MARRSSLFCILAVVSTVLLQGRASGQTCPTPAQGSPVIYGTCVGGTSGPTGSTAYIDASVFPGTDICAKINNALITGYTAGTVVDARGVLPSASVSAACAFTPFSNSNSGNNVTVASTILLPLTTILTNTTWVLPSGTRLLGGGTPPSGRSSGIHATLQVASGNVNSFTGSMIQMCGSTPPCTGITVEHLTLNGQDQFATPAAVYGILNSGAGAASYVDDITLANFELTGIVVSGTLNPLTGVPYTNQSGPYTNINYSAYENQASMSMTTCSSQGCPGCITLGAQTLGVDSVTCIGSQAVSSATSPTPNSAPAAILVQASGNSVRNVHIEAFWDGVQIGSTGSTAIPVKSIEISNISTATKPNSGTLVYGGVYNSVHICGTTTNSASLPCFTTPSTQSADVSVLGISNIPSSSGSNLVRDDVSNRSIATGGSGTNFQPMGMYTLGAPISPGSTSNAILTSASII